VEGACIKLRHFQIDHFFQSGGFGDEHPHRDDVARLALSNASEYLQRPLNGTESCVIGDTPADIQCARAINARAVAVATGMYDLQQLQGHRPDYLFGDLSCTDRVLNVLMNP
jgi:phosphoglycolate phosphatase